jgi:protoheme IX farnesyltransferase
VIASLLPYLVGMSGLFYLSIVLLLDAGFLYYALRLQFEKNNSTLAIRTFQFSLIYLTGLFAALLIDHHLLLS